VPIDEFSGEVTPERIRIARIIIVLAAFLTLMTFGVIFYRWATVHDPISAIVIEGDKTLDGAEIVVSASDNPDFHDAHAMLNENNGFKTPVLLDPGIYSVVISHRGKVILRRAFKLEAHRGLVFPLALLKAAETQPSAAGADTGNQ
jgi:hypothetical protein